MTTGAAVSLWGSNQSHSKRSNSEATITASTSERAKNKIEGSSLIVFGGSSGIGLATAVGAAQQGASQITICARDKTKLESAKQTIELASKEAGFSTSVTTASVDLIDESAVIKASIPSLHQLM